VKVAQLPSPNPVIEKRPVVREQTGCSTLSSTLAAQSTRTVLVGVVMSVLMKTGF